MFTTAIVLSMLWMAPATVVHEAGLVDQMKQLEADQSSEKLRDLRGKAIDRLREAIAKRIRESRDSSERRQLRLEAELAKLHDQRRNRGELDLDRWFYQLDLQGEDISALERTLFIDACAKQLDYYTYAQCLPESKQLDETKAQAELNALPLDPVLAHLARQWLAKAFTDIRTRFAQRERDIARSPVLVKLLEATTEAQDTWSKAYTAQHELFDAARPVEEGWVAELPADAYVGCDEKLDALLGARVVAGFKENKHDWATSALLRAVGLCALQRGDLATARTVQSLVGYGETVVRGPRTLARALMEAKDVRGVRGKGNGVRVQQVVASDAVKEVSWQPGRIQSLTAAGGTMTVRFRDETFPEVRWECVGSGRVTGIYRLGDGFGVSRDVSCGPRQVGSFTVKGAQALIPIGQSRGLKAGDYAEIYSVKGKPGRLYWAGRAPDRNEIKVVFGYPAR
jgi:hypothetical protein